jgi:hypothetical protein
MEMTIEELKHFIDQFSQIPEENVIEYIFTNKKDSCCIIGHYTRLNSENPNDYGMDNCSDTFHILLRSGLKVYHENRLSKLRKLGWTFNLEVAEINNGDVTNPKFTHYNEIPSAKQRGLKALNYLLTEMELKQLEQEKTVEIDELVDENYEMSHMEITSKGLIVDDKAFRIETKFIPQGTDFILGKSTFLQKFADLFK